MNFPEATTPEELDALPNGAIVYHVARHAASRKRFGFWEGFNLTRRNGNQLALPVLVLHDPRNSRAKEVHG